MATAPFRSIEDPPAHRHPPIAEIAAGNEELNAEKEEKKLGIEPPSKRVASLDVFRGLTVAVLLPRILSQFF